MNLPRVGGSFAEERRGIAAIQRYAADRGQIWRETTTGDVGIDGHLEFVNPDGFATGSLVAAQVKSGHSWFQRPTPSGWKFYPENKHWRYWESFPLPVLIILHDSNSGQTYWTDARQALRAPGRENAYIEVLAANYLESTEAATLFENAGVVNQPFISDLSAVLTKLTDTKSNEGAFPLSYFDLFVQGLTNISRSIYYGMDVVHNAVEYNLEVNQSPCGMGMGQTEQEFIFDFVRFLLAQNLAHVDYADCLIDWVDRQMQPQFVAPLTRRGRKLVELIHAEESRFVAEGKLPPEDYLRVAQEGFFQMEQISYVRRLPRIRHFQDLMTEEGSQ